MFGKLFIACFLLLFTTTVGAQSYTLDSALHVDGAEQAVILHPQAIGNARQEQAPYQLDYSSVTSHIDNYKWVYFVGQLIHGGLIVAVKPKFNP